MNRILICLLVFGVSTFTMYGQTEESAFSATGRGGTATAFVTDYQAIGINPANLGFHTEYGIALGIGEIGYGFYSTALERADVRSIIFNNDDTISAEDQATLAEAFLNEGFRFNVDILPVGVSFHIPNFGTLGISLKGNIAYSTRFAGEAANILFQGYDYTGYFDTVIVDGEDIYGVAYEPLSLSQLFEGTSIKMSYNSEINLAYGTKLLGNEDDPDAFKLYGGIGLKYKIGYAYLDFNADGGTITGVSALGLNILDLQPGETISPINENSLQPVGHGFGVDLGVSAKLGDNITLAAAITDMGKMHYTANVLQIDDYVLDTLHFSGLNTIDPEDILSEIFDNENIIHYSGLSDFTVNMPTRLRLGGSLEVGESLSLGIDGVFPMNEEAGSFASPILGLGGQLTILKILKLSAGISTGGGYGTNIPAGIGFDFHFWELGFATRDLTTWFGEASPNVSFAMGVLRFKI